MSEHDDGMAPKDARALILARRARFVSVALASVGLMTAAEGCDSCAPQVCLEPPPMPASSDDTTNPSVCLRVSSPEDLEDAGSDDQTAPPKPSADATDNGQAGADAGAADAGQDAAAPPPPAPPPSPPPPAPPRVCLRRAPHPCLSAPRICLSPAFDRPPPPPPPPPVDVPLKGALDGEDDERPA